MRKHISLILLLAASSILSFAQTGYPAKDIPDSLKTNADIITREYSQDIEIVSDSKMIIKERRVVTIMNERGNNYAHFVQSYTPFSPITSFSGALYDATGKRVKKIKNSDLTDQSNTSDNNLYDETRVKYYEMSYPVYPYTVEYSWEVTTKGVRGIPMWFSYNVYNEAIEKSSVSIKYPSSFKVDYKTHMIPGSVSTQNKDGISTISYVANNLKAIKSEIYAPHALKSLPHILFTTNFINFDGYSGQTDSWQKFGKFFFDLQKDRDIVSLKLQAEFAALKGKPLLEIAESVRKYLATNTRYISIQVGIGGYQPFPASDVEKTGYGDCKALANFAQTLFKYAGVPSYSTLINATENYKIDPTFVQDFFNHVILCVPNGNDTLWMDCTSPDYNLGYVPQSDAAKHVLLLTPEGGKIAKTTSYDYNQNLQNRNISFKISEQGNIDGSIITDVKNHQARYYFSKLKASVEDQRKTTLKEFSFSNPNIKSLSYENKKTADLNIIESISLTAENYGTIVGKRLFIPTVPLERISLLPKYEKRMFDIQRDYGYTDKDTIRFELPAGFKLESRPKDVAIETQFGTYTSKISIDKSTITIIRIVRINDGSYPASSYAMLYDFYKKMSESDNSKIVIIKEDS